MKRTLNAILAGLLLTIAGISFFYTPLGQRVEEDYGLALLFKLRGPRLPPEKAVIINIDNDSSDKLSLSTHFSKWPRSVHAALVDRLIKYGAKVIAFDIFFAEYKNRAEDLAFAEAIRHAGNVILVEELQHTSLSLLKGTAASGNLEMESLLPPIALLADEALALVPFPLPKIPVRVNQTWRFKTSSGEIPTLPAAVFQTATLSQYDKLHELLSKKTPAVAQQLPATAKQAIASLGLVETMRRVREIFLQNTHLQEDLMAEIHGPTPLTDPASEEHNLLALIAMYSGESSAGIDFYGPPASITTLSYHDVLSRPMDPEGPIARNIRGKAVFVGAARTTWSNQKDGFYTVFSQADGLDLSGVELAATVFTNLFENRSVHPLSAGESTIIILLSAVFACLVSFLLTPPFAGASLLVGGGTTLVVAHHVFSLDGTWIPLIIPLILQPFVAFIGANLSNYLETHRERRNISKALGFYLPDTVVRELSKDLSFINKGDKKVFSTCLITDAQDYTTLSENIPPEELSTLMKEYYRYLFREVKKTGGVVCNVIGDSMLAQWPSARPEAQYNEKACKAALQISLAVQQFNRKHLNRQLPTRIGLHSGYLLMDNIGAEDHFEYAPVGDIVNTVSRIEGLNKRLGTQILASEEALQGVAGIDRRGIGVFLLSGKTKPVTLYELLAPSAHTENWDRFYKDVFPEALNLFRSGKWEKALKGFDHCLTLKEEDGPSRFYRQLCASYIQTPPSADWQGAIHIMK
jgi:adenylate cyclase